MVLSKDHQYLKERVTALLGLLEKIWSLWNSNMTIWVEFSGHPLVLTSITNISLFWFSLVNSFHKNRSSCLGVLTDSGYLRWKFRLIWIAILDGKISHSYKWKGHVYTLRNLVLTEGFIFYNTIFYPFNQIKFCKFIGSGTIHFEIVNKLLSLKKTGQSCIETIVINAIIKQSPEVQCSEPYTLVYLVFET